MAFRNWLLMLILFATLMPAVVAGLQFVTRREADIAAARQDLAAAAEQVARNLADAIRATAQLHHGLARARDLDTDDRAACSAFLANVLTEYPQYTGLLTIRPDGTLFCDSLRTDQKLDLTDRAYFQAVQDPATPLAVEAVFGRLTGRAVLQVAYAARRDGGELAFVLLASVDLLQSIQSRSAGVTRQDEMVALLDAKGTVLAWYPDGDGLRGTSIASTPLFAFANDARGPAVRQDIPHRGTPHIWATAPLGEFPAAGLRILVGISTERLLAKANRDLYVALATQLAVWLVAFAGAWLLARMAMARETAEGERIRNLNDQLERALQTNVAALMQAQAALPDSEARLQQAQEIANLGSWELDLATGDYAWSRHLFRVRGMPQDFIPSRETLRGSVVGEDDPAGAQWLSELCAGHDRGPIEVAVTRADGKACMLRFQGRTERGPDGGVRRVLGTVQDVTDRRLVARQLAQAQKMEAIGSLTGGMAHDFNNLLSVIVLNLESLREQRPGDRELADLTGSALDAALSGADLTRRLLAFARKQSLQPRRIDVNQLVTDITRLIERTLGGNIEIVLALAADLRPVLADPAQLEASLVNLANNSRDAMPSGGTLRIATANCTLDADFAAENPETEPGSYIMLEVSDTGTGIPPEALGRIFEPFFTTKPRHKGTGLGLSMVFGFVRQSGGHVTVHSEPGAGTVFRLFLPQADGPADALLPEPAAPAARGGGETVLVVEDNVPLRKVVLRQLAALGYRGLEAENQADAAMLLEAERIDLLLTDIVMPGGIDGVDLARNALDTRPDLKVVFTSGFAAGHAYGESRALPPDVRLLTKPYSRKELADTLRAALRGEEAGR